MPPRGGIGAVQYIDTLMRVSSHAPVRGHRFPAECFGWELSFKSCPREGASAATFGGNVSGASFKSCPREGASTYQSRFLHSKLFQVMPP